MAKENQNPELDTALLDEEEQERSAEVPKYDDDEPNLVPLFMEHEDGVAFLHDLSIKILREFRECRDSDEELREERKKQWNLFAAKLPEREKEFKDMANISLTVLLESISRLTHRASAELSGAGPPTWDHPGRRPPGRGSRDAGGRHRSNAGGRAWW